MDTIVENDTLEAVVEMADPNVEHYANARRYRSAIFGPYPFPVKIRVRAYSVHVGNGNNSAAMRLMYNGEGYGEASDINFNRSNLQVLNHTILDPNQRASFRIDTTNKGADEAYFGLEFWLSLA